MIPCCKSVTQIYNINPLYKRSDFSDITESANNMAEVMRYKEDLYRNQQMDRRDAGRR